MGPDFHVHAFYIDSPSSQGYAQCANLNGFAFFSCSNHFFFVVVIALQRERWEPIDIIRARVRVSSLCVRKNELSIPDHNPSLMLGDVDAVDFEIVV